MRKAIEGLKQLPTVTQMALVMVGLVVLVLLGVIPTLGTSIITFAFALKTLLASRENAS